MKKISVVLFILLLSALSSSLASAQTQSPCSSTAQVFDTSQAQPGIMVVTNAQLANFTLTGPTTYQGGGFAWFQTNPPGGTYRITWGTVAGCTAPMPEIKTLSAGGSLIFVGNYQPKSALPANNNTQSQTVPSGADVQNQIVPPPSQATGIKNLPPPENVTDQAPTAQPNSFPSYLFYFVIAIVLVAAFFWKKLIELLKKGNTTEPMPDKKAELPAEAEKIPCPTCKGTGKITEHRTKSVPCGHCKEKGIETCHACSGTGKSGGGGFGVPLEDIENYPNDCVQCGGKGIAKPIRSCCMCKGKRKEEYQEAYEVPCPTCKGSGLVNNY